MKFSFDQKVLFKHCDPAGIVFYPRYFEMINDCVEAFFDKIGMPFETLHKDAALPTAQISTTFHAPSRHGDALVLSLRISHIGTSSLGLKINAFSTTQHRFDANSTLVYVNQKGRPQPWSDQARIALKPYFSEETNEQ
ncbi:MAG: thioesterase family protein [Aliishimia sp.]